MEQTYLAELEALAWLVFIAGAIIWISLRIANRNAGRQGEWWKWYRSYLRSPEWQERRRWVRQRSGGWCERCHQHRARECHHLSYKHVGNENPTELMDLCWRCHRMAHPGHRF